MFQDESLPLPPFTQKKPSEEHPRTATEVWDEYMDFREAVVDFFRDGHYVEIKDPGDARGKIDNMFYVIRRKYMRSILDKQIDKPL